MFQVPVTGKDDFLEAIRQQKRQQIEDERQKRIFNSKQRLFGIDRDALDRQVAEKQKQRHLQNECNRKDEDQAKLQQQLLYAKDWDLKERRRNLRMEIEYFRKTCQRKERAREFDLNDPNALKKAQPARLCYDDINLGPSSAQIFKGEDLHAGYRKRLQVAQQRTWLEQQMKERHNVKQAREEAERVMDSATLSFNKYADDVENTMKGVRQQSIDEQREFNQRLAAQKRFQRQEEARETTEDNTAELYNMLTSDMLTENPDVAQSHTHPNKKIAFMYRGMTPDELFAFRGDQDRQKIEHQKRRVNDAAIDKEWQYYALKIDQDLVKKSEDMKKKQRELLDDQVRYNKMMAEQRRVRREQEAKDRRNSCVGLDFFKQFNKTSR